MKSNSTRDSLLHRLGDAIVWACNRSFAAIEWMRRCFGAAPVENVTTDQVRLELEREVPSIVLVDVRSGAEQSISLIPGAITQQEYEANPERYSDKTIVTYCTVGGRSYLYARKLRSKGIVAHNYEDSILGWVRAGLPLKTTEGKPTHRVHPYWKIFQVPDDYEVP